MNWLSLRFSLLLLCCLSLACGRSKNRQALLHTSMGDIRVRLYDDTPRHRDFFIRLARSGAYDSLVVRRIERDFVVQSGFLNAVKTASAPASKTMHPLLRGALAANGPLFFIVQGRPKTEATLDKWEQQTGKKFSPELREIYKQKGGAPQLEGKHTVFGEVVEGLEVVDKIAALPRDADDRPLLEVRVWVEVL